MSFADENPLVWKTMFRLPSSPVRPSAEVAAFTASNTESHVRDGSIDSCALAIANSARGQFDRENCARHWLTKAAVNELGHDAVWLCDPLRPCGREPAVSKGLFEPALSRQTRSGRGEISGSTKTNANH